jgi:alkylation response protein AidB-like acyl-CoA dehydrogenase
MDLNYPAETEPFRKEVHAWLEENLPDGWFDPDFSMSPEERRAFNESWNEKLFAGGWICAGWPVEYGGKGLTLLQQVVLNEEFATAGAPMRADFFGDTLVGPTILQWGTDEQKREFIPGILQGKIAWCQGFSEPDAGSDLASLKTSAVLDGDEWVINGQKVWTSQAQRADYVFLMVRTDPDAPQHAGISYLLVPMHQEGVEVRPIIQVDGSADFNEVFFTNARCSKNNAVGGVNNGWKVAMTTLGFERGSNSTTGYRRFLKEWEEIVKEARRLGKNDDRLVRDGLVKAWEKVKIMEINGFRSLTDSLNGTHNTALLGACNKMFWSETHRATLELALDVLGMEAQILTGKGPSDGWVAGSRRGRADYPVSDLQGSFFFSRSETIWGGTAEIQRNIIGERALGLPKEPKPQRV